MKTKTIVATLFLVAFTAITPAKSQNQSEHTLDGKWKIKYQSNDIGEVNTVFTFQVKDTSFSAHTRRGADIAIGGIFKAILMRTFTKDFKKGSLMRITDGVVKQMASDQYKVKGIFRSAIGNYYFRGTIHGDSLKAELTNSKGLTKGKITGIKGEPELPLYNYPELMDSVVDVTRSKIYNPDVTESRDWRKFERKMKRVSKKATDDVEMVFAFFFYSRKLKVSHYYLMKLPPQDSTPVAVYNQLAFLNDTIYETGYLRITSFGGKAEEMDSIFSLIKEKNYKNLIVDLRNNSGGTVEAGMAFARHIVDTPTLGGIFLTQKWFAQNNEPPTVKDYALFPTFSEASFNLIIQGIHHKKGLVLKVIPYNNPYQGKMYVLTDGGTASTCEPIVYALKQTKRATIVGEKTAGAMLNGEFFKLPFNYTMVIPTADYYATDGYRIDQKGVMPDYETDPKDALSFTLELIKQQK